MDHHDPATRPDRSRLDDDRMPEPERYPPIDDYGFLADCHGAALVSLDGSIDWFCMPRIDSRAIFARLLGWDTGGYCRIGPTSRSRVERRYLEDSLILATTFRTDTGAATLYDFMPMHEGGRLQPYRQLLRLVECVEGEIELSCHVAPRFDYGGVAAWILEHDDGVFHAIGGSDGLLISTDLAVRREGRYCLAGAETIAAGDRRFLAMDFVEPAVLATGEVEAHGSDACWQRLEDTHTWWRRWAEQMTCKGFDADRSRRSAIVLKGLTHAPTGAIAAAATTSLPEALDGDRNWDYRCTWIRDSVFSARSLLGIGFASEADGFRRFVERATAGDAREVQVLYGVDGRHRLPEYEIADLEGYRGVGPVRVGNKAADQLQLDVFGELLDLAHRWHALGNTPTDDYLEFVAALIERTIACWREPDRGLWEVRGRPRHFVFSKCLCWAALDRGLDLADALDWDVPVDRWREERDAICAEVESRGYDPERGVFKSSFDSPHMDAALLLLPVFGFLPFDDERMVRTTDAIMSELDHHGLLRRYPAAGDELAGEEGPFVACTYWLCECLARQGRLQEAHAAYARATAATNDLGLFAEEYDPVGGVSLGNYPQGLSHLSQIAAATALDEMTASGG